MTPGSNTGRLITGLILITALFSGCSNDKKESRKEVVAVEQPVPADTVAPAEVIPEPEKPQAAPENNVAAYLAGMGQPSEIYPAEWTKYSISADSSWSRYHRSRTAVLRNWAEGELPRDSAANTLFYPFSGPDFLHAYTFFPNAKTFVLVGLEPVGGLPDSSQLKNPEMLAALQRSLYSVMSFSFFRTNAMAKDLNREELNGATPLLMLFLARTGQTIISYQPIQLRKNGSILPASDSLTKTIPGVRIGFLDQQGNQKELYYFSADLSDSGMGVKRGLGQFLQQFGPFTTYLKSASYLMHKAYFSQIRNLILDQSSYILQDDSGIALKYLDRSKWDFTFYGNYIKPISLFARHFQPALKAIYQDSANTVKPLPFGTGYDWKKNTSNLLLLKKKKGLIEKAG